MVTTAPPSKVRIKTFPVVEIFGPTIQGEGAEAGLSCHFVRLGGCDFRCTWCDTMYAVDPEQVRRGSKRMSSSEISDQVTGLGGNPEWVVLSGGNPALHELGELVDRLQELEFRIAVETQGSKWREWLGRVDRLTVSPKPPSSGMATQANRDTLELFMRKALTSNADNAIVKIVCFDEADLDWAKGIANQFEEVPLFLSAGTPVPSPRDLLGAVGDRYRWLCERVSNDASLARARVLPQLHVIAWGDATGV